jgi:16S rRNA (guanine1516-N2)-methyltransferase
MKIGIKCEAFERLPMAKAIADKYDLDFDCDAKINLIVSTGRLALGFEGEKSLSVDFCKTCEKGKKHPLAKACKIDKKPYILDTTAGWGKDAHMLASLGAKVIMCERSPIMALLLEDGLKRMRDSSNDQFMLSMLAIDAKCYLAKLDVNDYPDVILCDPMHPVRRKSAKVKKDMQLLQQLLGGDDDKSELVNLALTRAKERVVVKWPAKSAPLLKKPVDFSYVGKTIRYDVYLTAHS